MQQGRNERRYNRMTLQEYRKKQKKHHICRDCGNQDAFTLSGHTYCADCAEKQAAAKREQRAEDGGNFLVEILKRKLELCKSSNDVETAYNSVTAIDIQPDNCKQAKQRLYDMVPDYADKQKIKNILENNIICGDGLEIMKDWCVERKEDPK